MRAQLLKNILLAQGEDPNKKNPDAGSATAMHGAAKEGHLAVLHVLHVAGGDQDLRDEALMSPVMYAAQNNRTEIIKYLVEHKANIYLRVSKTQWWVY